CVGGDRGWRDDRCANRAWCHHHGSAAALPHRDRHRRHGGHRHCRLPVRPVRAVVGAATVALESATCLTGSPSSKLPAYPRPSNRARARSARSAGASLTIEEGEFICLIGASGCGKSTLLRLIGGFEAPSAGSVKMWNAPVAGPGPDRGMVFQDYALFPWLSVRGNIAFGPNSRGLHRKEVRAATDRFIEMVGLSKFADA